MDRGDEPKPLDPADPFGGETLELEYPCPWSYTVIVDQDQAIETVIAPIVGALEHTCKASNESRSGKYRSYQLEVTVPSDEERLRIFRELRAAEPVRYVF